MDRWYAAYDAAQRDCSMPLALVDSGWRWTCGWENFAAVYGNMVDQALLRPASAELDADYALDGDDVRVRLAVTNRSGAALGPQNSAVISLIVFENVKELHTERVARASVDFALEGSLADGARATYSLQFEAEAVEQWPRAVVVAVLDHRPDPSSPRYVSLQATIAGLLPGTPTPSATVAVATPDASATVDPSPVPEPSPRLHLPAVASGRAP